MGVVLELGEPGAWNLTLRSGGIRCGNPCHDAFPPISTSGGVCTFMRDPGSAKFLEKGVFEETGDSGRSEAK